MMARLNTLGRTELVDNTNGKAGKEGSFYRRNENAIYFDLTFGVETFEGHLLSPATVLNHEIDHALQDKLDPNQMTSDLETEVENYSNLEEKRVITGSEQDTARKHGEIKHGEVTRLDHHGIPMTMPNPTSNKNASPRINQLKEVIITPKKNENDKF